MRYFPTVTLRIYSPDVLVDGKQFFDLATVCQSDVLFLTVPINAFESVVSSIVPFLSPDTIVVDICSVKLHPVSVLQRYLPNCQYLSTHPMF